MSKASEWGGLGWSFAANAKVSPFSTCRKTRGKPQQSVQGVPLCHSKVIGVCSREMIFRSISDKGNADNTLYYQGALVWKRRKGAFSTNEYCFVMASRRRKVFCAVTSRFTIILSQNTFIRRLSVKRGKIAFCQASPLKLAVQVFPQGRKGWIFAVMNSALSDKQAAKRGKTAAQARAVKAIAESRLCFMVLILQGG